MAETELATILKLTVPVIVRIAERRVPMDDVLSLAPGAILELDRDAESPLTLLVNNRRIGTGEAVKVGENFGLRIQSIGGTRMKIQAMAPSTDVHDTPRADQHGEPEAVLPDDLV